MSKEDVAVLQLLLAKMTADYFLTIKICKRLFPECPKVIVQQSNALSAFYYGLFS
jgi:hypothetical protein